METSHDPVYDLERRLLTLELGITRIAENLEAGFAGVNGRLDALNGAVARHSAWISAHDTSHAYAAGQLQAQTAAQQRVSRRDQWLLGTIIAVAVLSANIAQVIVKLI